jgi:hypothetical protein
VPTLVVEIAIGTNVSKRVLESVVAHAADWAGEGKNKERNG